MQALTNELGLEANTHFSGWVAHENVGHLLDHADILILPSAQEGLPMAILEAMAHGLAIVSTPAGPKPSQSSSRIAR